MHRASAGPATRGAPELECPICGTRAATFLPFGAAGESDRKCPKCGSLERHRLVWLYFTTKTNLFTAPQRMLHVAPERCLAARLRAQKNIDYLSGDLEKPRWRRRLGFRAAPMMQLDITDMRFPDESFDVVYASHVLEHIPDDARAMRELCRVLSPEGWAILQVPIWGETTREDLSITDPAERTRLYGQSDHVRMYGHDGEYERRLTAAGFHVNVDRFAQELDPELARRYRLLTSEDVYFCTRGNLADQS